MSKVAPQSELKSVSPIEAKPSSTSKEHLQPVEKSPASPNNAETTPLKSGVAVPAITYAGPQTPCPKPELWTDEVPDGFASILEELKSFTRGHEELFPNRRAFDSPLSAPAFPEKKYKLPGAFKGYGDRVEFTAAGDRFHCYKQDELVVVDVDNYCKHLDGVSPEAGASAVTEFKLDLGGQDDFVKVFEIPQTRLLLVCSPARVDVCDTQQKKIISSLQYKEFTQLGNSKFPGVEISESNTTAYFKAELQGLNAKTFSGIMHITEDPAPAHFDIGDPTHLLIITNIWVMDRSSIAFAPEQITKWFIRNIGSYNLGIGYSVFMIEGLLRSEKKHLCICSPYGIVQMLPQVAMNSAPNQKQAIQFKIYKLVGAVQIPRERFANGLIQYNALEIDFRVSGFQAEAPTRNMEPNCSSIL